MSLTAIDLTTSGAQIPRVAAASVDITTGDTKGVRLTNTGSKPRLAVIVGTAAWTWHQTDATAAADCSPVASGERFRVQVPPGATIDLYCKTASTAKLLVSVEF
jgi:hypothetical protein